MTTPHLSIKDWDKQNRPREKAEQLGFHQLSDAELLAILIHHGTKGKTALDVAHDLLQKHQHNLATIAQCSIQQLKTIEGIGLAKAVTLLAALELGRRRRMAEALQRPQILSSAMAYACFAPALEDLKQEEFWVLYLNQNKEVLHLGQLNKGTVNQSLVDVKGLFRKALELNCVCFIMAHNHPSGNLKASPADKDLTERVYDAGQLLGIELLDHLIITQHQFLSFKDEGLF